MSLIIIAGLKNMLFIQITNEARKYGGLEMRCRPRGASEIMW